MCHQVLLWCSSDEESPPEIEKNTLQDLRFFFSCPNDWQGWWDCNYTVNRSLSWTKLYQLYTLKCASEEDACNLINCQTKNKSQKALWSCHRKCLAKWKSTASLYIYFTLYAHSLGKEITAAASQMTINLHQPPIFSPHIFICNSENERHLPGKQSPSREPDCASSLTATSVVRE